MGDTERYRFEINISTKYEMLDDEHEILFIISFGDHADSVRPYFDDLYRYDEDTGVGGLYGREVYIGDKRFAWDTLYFNDDTERGEPLKMIYRFIYEKDEDKEEDEEEYFGNKFTDEQWKTFKRTVLKEIETEFDDDYGFKGALNTILKDDDNPRKANVFFALFYNGLKTLLFEKKDGQYSRFSMMINTDITMILNIDVPITTTDHCNVLKLPSYKAQKLADDKNPLALITRYRFKDGNKTFIISYNAKDQRSKVMKIDCVTQGSTCKTFRNDDRKQHIVGIWYDDTIEIKYVYLGDAKGSGHCSKAVSYLLKVLLLESAKVHKYPYTGHVYISTSYPCHAVNCYAHAFINNGFKPDTEEIKTFREEMQDEIDSDGDLSDEVDFTFRNFFSEDQYKKYLQEKKRRKTDEGPIAGRTRRRKTNRLKL